MKRPARVSEHLLTGFLYCGIETCGMRMSVQGNSYVCQGVRLGHTCPGARAMAASVERAVIEAFVERVKVLPAGHPARKSLADQEVRPDRVALMQLWGRSGLGALRALLSAGIERVSVARAEGRGRRFDPVKRLRIVWVGEGRAE
ncbi:zinc ribbon domain-containing protein [Streptomyces sp. NBC_01003]|nr:zinc ribbon domain-containing protein [Streptomyces sp. NBC_01003]